MSSEARAQSEVRLEAVEHGVTLFRNNVGVLRDERGRPVRYGLANDSAQLNAVLKSSDLIGFRRVVITPEMVGRTVAVFTARECKASDWTYKGTEREVAQQRFLDIVNQAGGDAAFATGRGSFK
jgi:hypothetical protein